MLYQDSGNVVIGSFERLVILMLAVVMVVGVLTPPSPSHAQESDSRLAEIVVLGGHASVGQEVEDELQELADVVTRLAGTNRYATAATISREAFPDGASVVYVATGEDFADALAVGPLAVRRNGPILLTRAEELPSETTEELQRLAPDRIVVVGGSAAVGPAVEDALSALALVERLAGASRSATAVAVSRASHPDGATEVAIVREDEFADALSAGPLMLSRDGVILLTASDQLPDSTRAELLRLAPDRITVLGGRSAVSANVEADLENLADTVERIAGDTRYETSAEVARRMYPNGGAERALVADGNTYPDALTGISLATGRGERFAQGGYLGAGFAPIVGALGAVVAIGVIAAGDDEGPTDPWEGQRPTVQDLDVRTDENTPITIHLEGTSSDDDPLVFEIDDYPADATLHLDGDLVTFDPLGTPGTRTFDYVAWNGPAQSLPATVTVEVTAVPDPPVNSAPTAQDLSTTTPEDTAVVVTLRATDPDGDAVTFTADSGSHGTVVPGPASDQVTYTPDADVNGPDQFTYTASDGDRSSAPATVSVSVTAQPDPPVAIDGSGTTDEDVPFDGTLTGNDVDGDTITFALDPPDPRVTLEDTTGEFTFVPEPDSNGTQSFSFVSNDGSLTSTRGTVTVEVAPTQDRPTADDRAVTVDEDGQQIILLTGADVDGETLTFEVNTPPAHGTLGTIASTGPASAEVLYTPTADYAGPDSFTFTTDDGIETSTPATVAITVSNRNDPPSVVDSADSVEEDHTVTVVLSATDIDDDDLVFTIVSGPTHGTLAAIVGNGNGRTATVDYTPDPDYAGTDAFTYKASDPTSDSATNATVSLTVAPVNDPPSAADDVFDAFGNTELIVTADLGSGPALRGPGVRVQGSLLDNDDDPVEGDTLSVVPVADSPTTGGGSVTITADGSFAYVPEAGETARTDTFTYTVDDGGTANNTAAATVTIYLLEMIWYVDNRVAPGGDGRSHSPLDTVPPTLGGRGDIIHVMGTGTPYGTSGIGLADEQSLIGSGVPLVVGAPDLGVANVTLAPAGDTPVITSTAAGITLAQDNTVQGLEIGDTAGPGLVGAGFGTLAMSDVRITGTGAAVDLAGGRLADLPIGDSHIDEVAVVTGSTADRGIETDALDGPFRLGAVDITGPGHGLRFLGATGGSSSVVIDSLDVSVDGTALQASHLTSLVVDNNTAAQERLHSGGDQAIDLFDVPSLALTTDSVSSSNASAPGIDITSTGGSFTVEGTTTVTNNAATAVDIDSGPTTTFGGLVQASGVGGLQLTGGATTLSALGGLQATGTSGMGLDVGTGTTINVAGVGSTASSGTGTAVNILGTIGGVGVTFDSVSTNGGTDGIVLANTGAGAFTVTGGTGNDGGTIQGVANDGISLTNVGGLVSLTDMTISSTGRHGIRGQDVAGEFEAVRPTLTNIGNADDERGIWLTDPGAVTITDPDMSTIADTAIEVDRTVSTATGEVSITATTPGPHIRTTSAPFSGAGIELTAIGSGAAIAGGRIDGIGMTGIDGPAVRIIADGPLANPASIGTQGSVGSDSTGSFVVNDVTVGSVAPFVGGAAGGIQVAALDDATMDVDVRNVTVVSENAFAFSTIARDDADVVVELVDSTLAIANPGFGLAAVNAALAGNAGQSPVLHTTFSDNIIGVDGQADGAGSVGIAIGGSDSAGTLDAVLTGNEVINPSVSAVRVDRGKAADHIRGTITQTVVSTPQTTPEGGMDIVSTNGSGGAIDLVIADSFLVGRFHGLFAVIDDGAAGCLDVGTNTLTATDLTVGTGADVTVSGGSTLSFPGFSGGDASAYLIGRNTFIDPAPTVSGGPDGSTCATTRIR